MVHVVVNLDVNSCVGHRDTAVGQLYYMWPTLSPVSQNGGAGRLYATLPAQPSRKRHPRPSLSVYPWCYRAVAAMRLEHTRWLLKNTDTFAGFAHAVNSYLAGVALASQYGVGLIHRPQQMAHGLGFAFVDFFECDGRGVVPPVYAPTLSANATSMLIDGQHVQLYVQLAAAANASSAAQQLMSLPPHSMLWLRKGRRVFSNPSGGCGNTASDEVCYAALWLRERFWRAVLVRRQQKQQQPLPQLLRQRRMLSHHKSMEQHRRPASKSQSRAPSRMSAGDQVSASIGAQSNALDDRGQEIARSSLATEGGPIRICVHVRRGDVYYLGPKTRMPHPHWVDTTTVLDMLVGVGRALGVALELPRVEVDVFTEAGWMRNDSAALRAIAPHAQIHSDSKPSATISAMIQMAEADLLLMGSSGFSFWAGVFSCGVKVGYMRPEAELLPMRFVSYASTITTRMGPFWPSSGPALRDEWARYWSCRSNPRCRSSLCAASYLSPGRTSQGSVWTRSPLARSLLDDSAAVQWRLPELILWPVPTAKTWDSGGTPLRARASVRQRHDSAALSEMRHMCAEQQRSKGRSEGSVESEASSYDDTRLLPCVRNAWLHNLTAFLAARRKVPNGVVSVGG